MDFNFNQINFLTSLSDLPEKEKKEHTATALTLLGEERTNEEEELLSGLVEENLEEKPLLIGSRRHCQLPVFSNSVKLESQPGRGRFIIFIIISLLLCILGSWWQPAISAQVSQSYVLDHTGALYDSLISHMPRCTECTHPKHPCFGSIFSLDRRVHCRGNLLCLST